VATQSTVRLAWRLMVVIGLALAAGGILAYNHFIRHRMIALGPDLAGGTELLYRIRYEEVPPDKRQDLTERTIDVIRRRVDPRGITEMKIRERGRYRFYIQLPGMQPDQAKRIEDRMQQAGNLLFCLVNDDPEDRERARQGHAVRGQEYTPYIRDYSHQGRIRWVKATYRELAKLPPGTPDSDWLLVRTKPEVTGDYLDTRAIHPTMDEDGNPAVAFEFRGEGRARFARTTERNIGKRLAIILDNVLYSAPVIRSRIARSGIISGDFTPEEQHDLIIILQAGGLPANIELEWKNAVGPELGVDSIRAGLRAGLLGLIAVFVFMGVYYQVCALVANVSQILNLTFILAVLSLLPEAALSLPGIAGLILTIGMAVDANILIFERIREERARGKTPLLAARAGHERAFVTILDSNLTTLITALILYFAGTDKIRGFALILSIGIVSSMFCALFVARVFLELLLATNVLKDFRMLQLFRQPSLSFSRVRHYWVTASVVLIVAGLVVFAARSEKKYDTDFTGGFMAQLDLGQEMPVEEFRQRVRALYPEADIQSLAASAEERTRGEARAFTVRVPRPRPERCEVKLRRDLTQALKERGLLDRIEAMPGRERTYQLTLSRPAAEEEVRRALAAVGYTESSIAALITKDAPARNYELHLAPLGMTDREMGQLARQLRESLASHIVVRKSPFTVGTIQRREESVNEEGRRRESWTLELALEQAAAREAIREALVQQILGSSEAAIDVWGSGADAGAELCRKVTVAAADRALLQRIVNAANRPLEIPSFVRQDDRIRIELREPTLEENLRRDLDSAGLLQQFSAIVPQESVSKSFVVTMQPLSDDKVVQMIEDDLQEIFAGEIAQHRYQVTFVPAQAPAFVRDAEELVKEGWRFIRMELDHPVPLQNLQANLVRAGFPEALVLEGRLKDRAGENVTSAIIRLQGDEAAIAAAEKRIAEVFATPQPFRSLETIGPTVAGEMKGAAVLAGILSLGALIIYIWFRFGEFKFGAAAIIALVHDVLITMGAVAVADWLSEYRIGSVLGFTNIKLNLQMVAAFLTLIGYSLNDTIVVFDRIRENLGGGHRPLDPALVDLSINQTLSRSTLTSLTTLFVTLCLYFFGGPVLRGFSFALSFGIITGTYSSIFIAAPILLDWGKIVGFFTFRWLRRRSP